MTAPKSRLVRAAAVLVLAAVACAALAAGAIPSPQDPSIARGSKVFQRYCALCHGATGEGNGRAAGSHKPPPANLVRSPAPDAYKELIIRRGGAAVGRSPFMPPWGQELSDEDIRDLLSFLRHIKVGHA